MLLWFIHWSDTDVVVGSFKHSVWAVEWFYKFSCFVLSSSRHINEYTVSSTILPFLSLPVIELFPFLLGPTDVLVG